MNIISTRRDLTGPAARRLAEALPDTDVTAPGVVGVETAEPDATLDSSEDWRRVYAALPRSSGWDLLAEVVDHGAFVATETAARTLLSLAPDTWRTGASGVFWAVDLTRAGLAVRKHVNAPAEDRDGFALLATTAGTVLDGAALGARWAGRPTAALDGLGLLVRYTEAGRKGHNLGLMTLHDRWREDVPLYRLADGMMKVTEAALSPDPADAGVTLNPWRAAIASGGAP